LADLMAGAHRELPGERLALAIREPVISQPFADEPARGHAQDPYAPKAQDGSLLEAVEGDATLRLQAVRRRRGFGHALGETLQPEKRRRPLLTLLGEAHVRIEL